LHAVACCSTSAIARETVSCARLLSQRVHERTVNAIIQFSSSCSRRPEHCRHRPTPASKVGIRFRQFASPNESSSGTFCTLSSELDAGIACSDREEPSRWSDLEGEKSLAMGFRALLGVATDGFLYRHSFQRSASTLTNAAHLRRSDVQVLGRGVEDGAAVGDCR
jgi:hypothetical protein